MLACLCTEKGVTGEGAGRGLEEDVAICSEQFTGVCHFAVIRMHSLVLLSDLGCGSVTNICLPEDIRCTVLQLHGCSRCAHEQGLL